MNAKKILSKGIKVKVVAWILATILTTVLLLSATAYVWGKTLLRGFIVNDRREMASLMASSVANILNEEVSEVEAYLSSQFWIGEVQAANESYRDMGEGKIREELLKEDKRWVDAGEDDPQIGRYLNTPLSLRLRRLEKTVPALGEIFLTDRYGGLVAASRRTTDFYQADEGWWIKAYNNGAGDIFVGDLEEDKSAGVTSVTLAVPVRDDAGKVIGVCKAVLSAYKLFAPIREFKIGDTGHAVLVDKEGYIISHVGVECKILKIGEGKDVERIMEGKEKGVIIQSPHIHSEKIFMVGEEIKKSPVAGWSIFVDQEVNEVFMAVRKLYEYSLIVMVVFMVIAIPAAYLIGGSIVSPVEELNAASRRFAAGDLDYRINSGREDEIGELARAMDTMAGQLKGTYVSIDRLQKEITVRKNAETALRDSEARYKTIYESSKDAVMTLIPYGKFLGGNPATIDMFGCSGELEFIRQAPWDISPEYQPDGRKSLEKANEMMRITVESGSNFFEWQHKRLNGEEFPATVLLTRMRIGGEMILQATVRDITDQKRAEKVLMETIKLKSDFTSMVSHELRTPLTAIREGIEMVRDGSMGRVNHEQKDFLDTAKRNVDRLTRLINDVLDFSRIEAGKMEMPLDENDISWAINEVVSVQKAHAAEKGIYLEQAVKKDIPKARFNFDRIVQVITNLVNNALKFTGKGGITVSADTDQGRIRVTVEDTGEGIRQEDIGKVFEEFRQLEDKNTRKTGGAGLGLAISKRIIEKHGGDIWIESEYGRGTRAIFTIPL